MEIKAKRTLVKSAPEIWELTDDPERMRAWMGVLTGCRQPVAVSVTTRDAGRALAWRSRGAAPAGAIAIELSESGFGTAVAITARHSHPNPGEAIAALEALLDELGSPDRRPFARD
jgi:hypothetical protein